ncbi:release factor glutamine methyltransferase [Haloactinopolyspora alba]|uniref:peptide chain release factor N(5)-glutamine methyltransferase n=1 Tax=Haloactinopolyspora alba TaxID=648780 RepID=A0A2P8DYB6_9ACTN|nr:putative protein N(5)-glutamine methyltransferase [Haloactinopolyspora alba]PSL02208.1 release factor glutamine methyltransferase [Haloactinopolyspora alba]
MPTSISAPDHDALVQRLRGAGCVFAEDEARLLVAAADTPAELDALVERRVDGLPLEQVLGWAEFCGLRVGIEPGVFVPRQRTAFLVHRAAELVGGPPGRPAVVLDMCCGTGALGMALAERLGSVELHAADVEPAAVRCARRNIAAGGHVYQGDLYEPLPATLRGRVDLLVVNAPYVPTDAVAMMPPEARHHEPMVALDGGADGVGVHRRVAAGAARWLAPGGHLLIETSEYQLQRTVDAVAAGGLAPSVSRSSELDATVVVGTRPSARL